MNRHKRIRPRFVAAMACAVALSAGQSDAVAQKKKKPRGPERWEKAIAAFEKSDAKSPPPKGAILFAGSSSIRLWKLETPFPKLPTINRGFGGSQIADSVHFADRIILKHEPKTVVLYAGDNDVAAGKSPQQVAADFRRFVQTVHKSLPRTRILFIAIKPSLRRWKLVEKMREANRLIAKHCEANDRLTYIDVDTPMLGKDGKPRPELFVKDGLHLSPAGYAVWAKTLRPHLTP
jgi:lysophospholipase L1-like esterase